MNNQEATEQMDLGHKLDWSVPQRQAAIGLVLFSLDTLRKLIKGVWPLLIVVFFRGGDGDKDQLYFWMTIGGTVFVIANALLSFWFFKFQIVQEEFIVKKGPIFTNFVLADEINRAPAKVQSALLESMQERQVTIGDETYKLEEPFLVMATQNPIEQEGTYPLPEAQVDRFMLKVVIDYPKKEEEQQIIRHNLAKSFPKASTILKPEDIIRARQVVKDVYMDEKIEKYIVDIVFATRFPDQYGLERFKDMISYGASPRASISLSLAAKAYAFIKRRGYVIPEDVRAVCHDVMRHRIGLSYEAEANNITSEEVISEILNQIEVP